MKDWVLYPENKPTEPGYYCTWCYSVQRAGFVYKALSYVADEDYWEGNQDAKVYMFVPISYSSNYVECLDKIKLYL
jgi:hypothetical protein